MRKRHRHTAEEYIQGVLSGNRMMLSKAITLIESTLPDDFELGQEVIAGCISQNKNTIRIGITGVPGAGKSTFIDAFGMMLTNLGKKIAVLAIDPSSKVSGGSILGDKTRMQNLSMNPLAYIRPSPSSGSLGGVARKTKESLLLCEAAGFEIIIVETVGVGQSETSVRMMTDFFLLLMLPNAGDDLQGIKKGIMEMADALLINKADGAFLPKAKTAKALYSQALRLFPPNSSQWIPPVQLCSSLEKTGLTEIWETMLAFQQLTKSNQHWEKQRQEQALAWMHQNIQQRLTEMFFQSEKVQKSLSNLSPQVIKGAISPMQAADILLQNIAIS